MKSMARCSVWRLGMMLGAFIVAACTISACNSYSEPWCSITPITGSTQCRYRSLDQCNETVSGLGGYCVSNPQYTGSINSSVRRRARTQ